MRSPSQTVQHHIGTMGTIGTMAKALAAALMAAGQILVPATPARAELGLDRFCKAVMERAYNPTDESNLEIVCKSSIHDKQIILDRSKGEKISIAIFADASQTTIKDVRKELVLKPLPKKGRNPPDNSNTGDWGYIYDRNGDGKIDYLAYHMYMAIVANKTFPPTFPKPDEDGRLIMNYAEMKAMLSHTHFVFRHSGDNNYDGTVDFLILEDLDPAYEPFPLVRRWGALEGPEGRQTFKSRWYFLDTPSEHSDALQSQEEIRYHDREALGPVNPVITENQTYLLSALNQAASECGLLPGSILASCLPAD